MRTRLATFLAVLMLATGVASAALSTEALSHTSTRKDCRQHVKDFKAENKPAPGASKQARRDFKEDVRDLRESCKDLPKK